MARDHALGMMKSAVFVGIAACVLTGCSTVGSTTDPTSSGDGQDSANVEVTPIGTWVLDTDDSVELVVSKNGTFEVSPCSATGKWADEGDHLSVDLESMLDVGGCPETINLAFIERITIDGESLVVSDSENNEETFHKTGD